MADAGVLLIDDGDLPSLAATTLEWRPRHVALYHHRGGDPAAGCREAVVAGHGAALDCEHVVIDRLPPLPVGAAPDVASVLTRAAAAAVELKCHRVLWPRHVGPDPERLGRLVQQADAAAALTEAAVAESGEAHRLAIDVPLADLTDAQLVELAEQGGSPMQGFWPCHRAAREPCGRCEGCLRWRAAFRAAAVAWPW